MDWINDLNTQLKTPFVFPNGGFEPIVIKNPTIQFRWRTVFITGEISFSTFENIVDDELFNFDIDFVRPLQGGNMMLVGKPVRIKLALEPNTVYRNFDIKMRQDDYEETLNRLISDSESQFLLQYHWMVLTMFQNQNNKKIGHETVWNLIDYDNEHLIENWDDLVGHASLPFVESQGLMDDFMTDVEENDFSPDELSQIFNQAKDQIMDKDNPMGNVLSKMFGNEGDFQDAISESMNQMLSMFGGMEENEEGFEEEEFEGIYEAADDVIVGHLEMLEIPYEAAENEAIYNLIHKSEITEKPYECSIISGEDYIHVVTTYDQVISKDKWNEFYRLVNGLNTVINLGKLLFIESLGILAFRTEMSTPIVGITEEPITDIIDENWVYSNDVFYLIDNYLAGKMNYEEVLEEAEDSFL